MSQVFAYLKETIIKLTTPSILHDHYLYETVPLTRFPNKQITDIKKIIDEENEYNSHVLLTIDEKNIKFQWNHMKC